MRSGPGRGYPRGPMWWGRDEVVNRALQPHRVVQGGAPPARPGRLGPRRSDLALTKLVSGEPGGRYTAVSGFRDPTAGRSAPGLRASFNHQNLVTTWGDFGLTDSLDVEFVLQQALGTIDNRYICQPRNAAYVHTGVALVLAHGGPSDSANSTSTIRCRRSRSRPANQLAYVFRGGRAAFITRRFMWGVRIAQVCRLSPTRIRMRNRKNGKFGLAVFF